eukprot:358020-Chlamydomonas_euryale.AAC.11
MCPRLRVGQAWIYAAPWARAQKVGFADARRGTALRSQHSRSNAVHQAAEKNLINSRADCTRNVRCKKALPGSPGRKLSQTIHASFFGIHGAPQPL